MRMSTKRKGQVEVVYAIACPVLLQVEMDLKPEVTTNACTESHAETDLHCGYVHTLGVGCWAYVAVGALPL